MAEQAEYKIRTRYYGEKAYRHHPTVLGERVGKYLAVRDLGYGGWAIDHLPTGASVVTTLRSRADAMKVAETIAPLAKWGFRHPTVRDLKSHIPEPVRKYIVAVREAGKALPFAERRRRQERK